MSVLLLVLLLALVAINGFFVAGEFALVRSRRGKLEQLAEEGESGAEEVIEQLDKIDESLSACQIGITMASIGIGFLGEPSLAKLIEPVFGGLSHGAAVGLSVVIAFALVTSIHISIGEQVPKMIAVMAVTLLLLAPCLGLLRDYAERVFGMLVSFGLS